MLKLDGARVAALVGLGNVERIRKHHEAAAKFYDQAIDLIYRWQPGKKRDAALASYRECRAIELVLLAEEDRDAKSFGAASSHYERALDDFSSIKPERDGKLYRKDLLHREHFSALTLLGLGRCALGSGQPARAVELLNRALDHAVAACKLRQGEKELKDLIEADLAKALREAGLKVADLPADR